jgi:uncharacterized protein (TIGR03067 family)
MTTPRRSNVDSVPALFVLPSETCAQLAGARVAKGTSKIDPSKKPKTIDLTAAEGDSAGKTALGIYELEKDSRKVCIAKPGDERPTEFASEIEK